MGILGLSPILKLYFILCHGVSGFFMKAVKILYESVTDSLSDGHRFFYSVGDPIAVD